MRKQENNSNPYTILAFCFADRARVGEVMKELKVAKTFEENRVVAEAIVEVDEHGKAHVHQHGRGGVGAAAGIMAGEALALIGGPAGLLVWAVAGGAIGGAAGHFVDRAFTKEDLAKLKDQMPPNSSAILTMAKDSETERIMAALQSYQAAVVTLTLGAEAAGAVDQSVAAGTQESSSEGKASGNE
jgi:uncharacterized membrane protein